MMHGVNPPVGCAASPLSQGGLAEVRSLEQRQASLVQREVSAKLTEGSSWPERIKADLPPCQLPQEESLICVQTCDQRWSVVSEGEARWR